MTQDPNAKARELFRTVWWDARPSESGFEDKMVKAFAAALTEARAEALEEAAKQCDVDGDICMPGRVFAEMIRALKEKA